MSQIYFPGSKPAGTIKWNVLRNGNFFKDEKIWWSLKGYQSLNSQFIVLVLYLFINHVHVHEYINNIKIYK